MKRTLFIGLAFFMAGFLPYAISRDYTPTYSDVMSRTCLIGAFAGALWLTAFIESMRSEQIFGIVIYFALIALFAASDIQTGYWWAQSWMKQQESLAIVKKALSIGMIAKNGTVTYPGPFYLNGDINPVIVFSASWDFDSAVRLATGRDDLKGVMGG